MTAETPTDRPLGGLVSAAAEALYARLSANSGLPIGTGPDEVDPGSPAARELLDLEVAYSTPYRKTRLYVVSRTIALQLLISRRHHEVTDAYETVLRGWDQLGTQVDSSTGIHSQRDAASSDLVLALADDQEAARVVADLCAGAVREIRYAASGASALPVSPPDRPGVRIRTIYDRALAANRLLDDLAGAEVRIRGGLPMTVVHVDDEAALLSFPLSWLLIRSPQLLSLLADWFDRIWTDSSTTVIGQHNDVPLSASQSRVLRLLAAGMTDETVAESCGMSVRTVRRHVTAILGALDVTSRFAIGVEAARRGWI